MQLAAKEHQCSLILFALLFYSLPILTAKLCTLYKYSNLCDNARSLGLAAFSKQ
jgi:hypothetical protein